MFVFPLLETLLLVKDCIAYIGLLADWVFLEYVNCFCIFWRGFGVFVNQGTVYGFVHSGELTGGVVSVAVVWAVGVGDRVVVKGDMQQVTHDR